MSSRRQHPEILPIVFARLEDGRSTSEIAAELGIATSTVEKMIGQPASQGLIFRRKITMDDVIAMRIESAKGMSRRKIAKELGFCIGTVNKYLGPTKRGPRRVLPPALVLKIISMRARGMRYTTIAGEVGVSVPAVRAICLGLTHKQVVH